MDYKYYKEHRKIIDFQIIDNSNVKQPSGVKIAIIIPHRNRLEHLKHFIDHLNKLNNNYNTVDVYIIDQNNADKFNRGLLLNIGYLVSKNNTKYDRYIFHDIDSYPDQSLFNLYFDHLDKVIHFASPNLGYKYNFYTFFGGVVGVPFNIFEKMNGYPNNFFGWGGEDDAFYNRIAMLNIPVYRPSNGSYILDDHSEPTKDELNNTKQLSILHDLKNYTYNGIKQLLLLFINIKKYENLDHFIKQYDNSNIIEDDNNNLNKYIDKLKPLKSDTGINYFFYKIDYLSLHNRTYDKLLDYSYMENKIKKRFEDMKCSEKKNKCYQHKTNKSYISYLKPILFWEEIKNKIIDTYTEPKQFIKSDIIKLNNKKLNLNTNKIAIELDNVLNNFFKKYDGVYNSKNELFDTIKYIFNAYNEIIYFRIRNNKITRAYHITNPNNRYDWYKYVKYLSNDGTIKNIDDSLLEIMDQRNKQYNTLNIPHFMSAHNCLIGFDAKLESNAYSYVNDIKNMIKFTVKVFGNVPDCDLLLNRKDFPYLRKDKRYAYNELVPDINYYIPSNNKYFWIVGSQSLTDDNLDIPVPSADEWKYLNNNKITNLQYVDWKDKINVAFFRGTSTGCGNTIDNNVRLKLSDISYKDKTNTLDVGISSLINRIKVKNSFVVLFNYDKLKYLIKPFVSYDQQLKYKYIFNIQGNAQAYRYSNEFKKKSVILNVKSDYYMWFEPLLIPNKHIVQINSDYSNLFETINYLKDNDDIAEQIANNGFDFSKKYIRKKVIALYWLLFMINVNKHYKYN